MLPHQTVPSEVPIEEIKLLADKLTSVATKLINDEPLDPECPHSWLKVYDNGDLRDFIEEMRSLRERLPNDLVELDALIHEWHESALVISSGILAELNPQ